MPTTPGLALPYPALSDTPDVPYWLQQLAQQVEAKLSNRPRCRMVTGADQSIPNGTATVVDFAGGTVVHDNNAMADLANDQIVIKTAGYYVFTARVAFGINSAGYRAVLIGSGTNLEGVDDYRAATPTQSAITTLRSYPILCAVGDAFNVRVVQTSGAALNLIAANNRRCSFGATWVGGQ